MRKKLLAAFLALVMVLALLPGTVFAQAEDAPAAAADERTAMIAPAISYADGKVTITRSELLPAEAKIYYAVGENLRPNIDDEEFLYTAPFEASEGDVICAAAYIINDSGYARQWSDVTVYKVGLPSLGTPTDLEWNKKYVYEYSWNESTGKAELTSTTAVNAPGWSSWKTASPNQNEARVRIYHVGESMPVGELYMTFGAANSFEYCAGDAFTHRDLGSGTYYFTVQSMGDGISYNSSAVAVSDTWTYTQPSEKLPRVEVGEWSVSEDGRITANWTRIEHEQVGGYEIWFFFSESAGGEMLHAGGLFGVYGPAYIDDEVIQNNGPGYYYFQVRALTNDVTQCQNGEWSEMSRAYDLTEVYEDVKGTLDSIDTEGADEETIIEAVQQIDPDELYTAMLTDQNAQRDEGESSGVIDRLAELERAASGGTAAVEVNEKFGDFTDNVSVVGANLNKQNPGDKITLVVDEPKAEHVIPERYNSTMAVSFSMELQKNDVTYDGQLAVPVQVTLPIPETINPAFLVIIHYGQGSEDEPEYIYPYIFKEDGKYFASFVLDHFSDFAMVDTVAAKIGDRFYSTVQDAVNIIKVGETIELTENATEAELKALTAPAIEGEFTISGALAASVQFSAAIVDGYRYTATVTVNDDGTVTVKVTRTVVSTGGGGGFTGVTGGSVTVSNPSTANGTVTSNVSSAQKGNTVTITSKANTGYISASPTVKDKDGKTMTVVKSDDGTWSFTMPEGGVTVTGNYITPAQMFSDVDDSKWYRNDLAFAVEHGLIEGYNGKFDPDTALTRGMMVTLLYNLEGKPTAPSATFTDVVVGQYYTDAVAWAAANKVVEGYNNAFRPNEPLDRQSMATILYNYAAYKGYNVSGLSDLSGYIDAESIASWALTGMRWANSVGVVTGSNSALNPTGNSSRIMGAVLLAKYCREVVGMK